MDGINEKAGVNHPGFFHSTTVGKKLLNALNQERNLIL